MSVVTDRGLTPPLSLNLSTIPGNSRLTFHRGETEALRGKVGIRSGAHTA